VLSKLPRMGKDGQGWASWGTPYSRVRRYWSRRGQGGTMPPTLRGPCIVITLSEFGQQYNFTSLRSPCHPQCTGSRHTSSSPGPMHSSVYFSMPWRIFHCSLFGHLIMLILTPRCFEAPIFEMPLDSMVSRYVDIGNQSVPMITIWPPDMRLSISQVLKSVCDSDLMS